MRRLICVLGMVLPCVANSLPRCELVQSRIDLVRDGTLTLEGILAQDETVNCDPDESDICAATQEIIGPPELPHSLGELLAGCGIDPCELEGTDCLLGNGCPGRYVCI